MYHSIADGDGPTYMPATLFRDQLALLQESGYRVAALSELRPWLRGEAALPERTAVLTFDDALTDFADTAAPAIAAHGWSATLFVPTAWVGRKSEWVGADPSQAVLDWPAIRGLSEAGFDIGSHAETHSDLTRLSQQELRRELVQSKARIEQELQRPAPHFAAPYGAANAAVRAEIARHYDLAVGVRLGRAERTSDAFDLPRIEMHYFRSLPLWRDFLNGRGDAYFAVRQAARAIRSSLLS